MKILPLLILIPAISLATPPTDLLPDEVTLSDLIDPDNLIKWRKTLTISGHGYGYQACYNVRGNLFGIEISENLVNPALGLPFNTTSGTFMLVTTRNQWYLEFCRVPPGDCYTCHK